MKKLLLTAAFVAMGMMGANAQIAVTTGSYINNFNSMGTGTPVYPTGWNAWKVGGTGALAANSYVTTATTPAFTTSTGSATTASIYNFGTTTGDPNDRSLGTLADDGFIGAIGASFQNNTGFTLTSSQVNMGFNITLWRSGNNSATETMAFSYKIGGNLNDTTGWTTLTTFDLVEPNPTLTDNTAKDGHAIYSTVTPTAITGLSWAPGAVLNMRWVDSDGLGNDSAIAIDNFQMNIVPEPSTYALFGVGFAGLLVLRRIKKAREV